MSNQMSNEEITQQEQIARLIKIQPRGKTVICACGHLANNHNYNLHIDEPEFLDIDPFTGIRINRCKNNKVGCGCTVVNPVIIVDNANWFQKKYTGPGLDSALTKGIELLTRKGGSYEKLYDYGYKCVKCQRTDVRLTATSTDSLDSLKPGHNFVHKPYFPPLSSQDADISGGKYHVMICGECS